MAQYTITEEQIKELAKWKHGKRLTQEWFPEAFETKLEVGKWYKSNDILNHIFYVTKLFDGKYFYYGFNSTGNYEDNDFYLLADFGLKNGFTNATESEVFEALKKEAVKRGFVECCKIVSPGGYNCDYNLVEGGYFSYCDNILVWTPKGKPKGIGIHLFSKGQWAKPIKEKTLSKAEAEAKLTELCKDGFEYKIEF